VICTLFPCLGNVPYSPRKRAAVTPLDGCKKLRWLVRESKRRAHPGLPEAGGFRKTLAKAVHGGEEVSCVGEASGYGTRRRRSGRCLHSSIATDEAWAGEIDGRGRTNCCGMKVICYCPSLELMADASGAPLLRILRRGFVD
jgi:hypothetical protein